MKEIAFDFNQLEELFCQKQRETKPKSPVPNASGLDTAVKSPAVTLLDSKRSLTINIFLRQFKNGIPEVIDIVEGAKSLSVDTLKGLLKILPDSEEVSEAPVSPERMNDLNKLISFILFIELYLRVSDYFQSVSEILLPPLGLGLLPGDESQKLNLAAQTCPEV